MQPSRYSLRSRLAATVLGLVACAAPATAVVLRAESADAASPSGYLETGSIPIRQGTYGPTQPLWEGTVAPGWAYSAVVNVTVTGIPSGPAIDGAAVRIRWECGQRTYAPTYLGGSYSVQLFGQWIVPSANANLLLYPNDPVTGRVRNCKLAVAKRTGLTVTVTTWGQFTGTGGVADARLQSHIQWWRPDVPATGGEQPEPTDPPSGGGGAGNTPPPWGGEAGSTPPPAWTPPPTPTPTPPPWGGAPGSTIPPTWTPSPRPSPTPPLSPIEWCEEGYGLPALCELVGSPAPTFCLASPPPIGPAAPTPCPTPSPSPTPTPPPTTCTWRIGPNGYWRIEGTAECIATSPFLIPQQTATIRLAAVDAQLVGSGSGTGEVRELMRVYQTLSVDGTTWGSASHYVSVSNITATGTATWATSGLVTYDVGATGGSLVIGSGGRYIRLQIINCTAPWSAFNCTTNSQAGNFMVELVTVAGALGPTPTPSPTAAPTPTPGPGTPPPSLPPGEVGNPDGLPTGPEGGDDPGECLPGEVPGPLSGECKQGVGYQTPGACASPWPSLNPLDYFAWLGCILSNIPVWVANALAWIANMILDLFIPGEGLGPMLDEFFAGVRERAPFGWVEQATDAVSAGLTASAITVDTSFNLAGFTVNVPLYDAASSLAPYRGVVLAFFLFAVVLAILRSLRGAMGVGGGGGGGDDD